MDPGVHGSAVQVFNHFFQIPRAGDETLLHFILKSFALFPYENLSKIIKYEKHRDGMEKLRLPLEVMQDHVEKRLGGTCFSLTFFLQTILTDHGFQNYPVMADMSWGSNVHCALIVILGNREYLVDPGYLFTQPMELPSNTRRLYRTEFSGVELAFDPGTEMYHLRTFDKNQVKWRYCFIKKAVEPQRFLSFWLDSFRWNSMHGLCLNRVSAGKMTYIHKTYMRETDFHARRNFQIRNRYHETIKEVFGIDPELTEEALASLNANMAWEREMGIWKPRSSTADQPGIKKV